MIRVPLFQSDNKIDYLVLSMKKLTGLLTIALLTDSKKKKKRTLSIDKFTL